MLIAPVKVACIIFGVGLIAAVAIEGSAIPARARVLMVLAGTLFLTAGEVL